MVPVSSSAQLALLPDLLGWKAPVNRTAFASALHAGSCVGLAVALRHDLRALDRRTAGWLALSTVPAAVAGLVGQDLVERRLGGAGPTAGVLAAGGLLMLAADRRPQDRSIGPGEVAVAAVAQVLALVPGMSRAGITVTALRAMRVRRREAARFSLLMSLPVTAGAAALTGVRSRETPPLVPTVLAGVASWGAATVSQPGSHRWLSGAAVYRLSFAAAVAVRLRKGSR